MLVAGRDGHAGFHAERFLEHFGRALPVSCLVLDGIER
jgi:hypothetical protein